ncbi:MAG TPA: hypothetical protein VGK35_12275 [Actinotalea sp.]|jgi:hypothetical protein
MISGTAALGTDRDGTDRGERVMLVAYRYLARLIAVGVVLQAAFIAFAMFDILHAADGGTPFTGESDNAGQALHSTVGMMVIPVLALLMLVVSFFARIPGGVVFAVVVLGLVAVQVVLGFVSAEVPSLGLLHGVTAFAIAGAAGIADRRAGQALRSSAEAGSVAAA